MMKEKKPVYVLGTGLSHDGSACLLKDGKIIVAIEKERITRRKHDGRNDDLAVRYCLEAEKIGLSDIELIVQCGDGYLHNRNHFDLQYGLDGRRFVNEYKGDIPLITLSHHLAHAYNAIGTSPFDEMAVLVIDGSGQEMKYCMDIDGDCLSTPIAEGFSHLCYEKDSFYHYSGTGLSSLYKDYSPWADLSSHIPMSPAFMTHSIGDMYEQASVYCLGINGADKGAVQAGKLMGLAPYGKPGIYTEHLYVLKDGRVFINYDQPYKFDRPCRDHSEFKSNFQYYADIAYWVQEETEKAILYLIDQRSRLCNTKNLAFTGGVALNAVTNGKILDNSVFEKLYLTPAAGDNGLAIGCAYYGWLEILKRERIPHNGGSSFGRIYPTSEIAGILESYRSYSDFQTAPAIDNFFKGIPDCTNDRRNGAPYCKVQFIIKDVNVYTLEVADGRCSIKPGGTGNPDGMVVTDSRSFTEMILDRKTVPELLANGKLELRGKAADIYSFFDKEALRLNMQNAIISQGGTPKGVVFHKEDDVIDIVARLLSEGKVIGWFQGRSEFGPRALGNRSILADPRKKDVRHFINSRVKLREDFRPFAPSVLLEDVTKYFHYDGESPYMILVVKVRDEWKDVIPNVVHEDNSCRIQTVTPELNGNYYELLKKFKEFTGVGILLNTSFNNRGMPLVETPRDALDLFYQSELDVLVIDNYLVYKN